MVFSGFLRPHAAAEEPRHVAGVLLTARLHAGRGIAHGRHALVEAGAHINGHRGVLAAGRLADLDLPRV